MKRLTAFILLLMTSSAWAQNAVGPVGRPIRKPQPAASVDAPAVAQAIQRGKAYLLEQIGESGKVEGEYPPENPRFGGRTVVTIYALLQTGVDPDKNERLARAIDWAIQADLNGTYAVGFRAAAMSLLKDERTAPLLQRDAEWLIRAAGPQGRYTYTPIRDEDISGDYDNVNGHVAALGVWSAQGRGIEVPLAYWQRIQRHWLAEQQPDGGWGYRLREGENGPTAQTYGSMTAAGVATLHECLDSLGRDHFLTCKPLPHGEAIDRGMAWLEQNFSARLNPKKGVEWYDYWLFGLQRVGTLTGRQLIGETDWYAAGAAELLRRQHSDGSWGYGVRVDSTAFSIMFLSHGQAPTLLSKVSHAGRWNARPRDAANLVRWLGYTYERRLGWHVIDINADVHSWDAARVLYFSGAGPIVLSDEQIARLREFVQRGGLILSEAACDNGDFTMDMHRIYQRMFPEYRLESLDRIEANHPLYSLQFTGVRPRRLYAVHNGVRPLAIHSPQDLSLSLELGPGETGRPTFELMANLYLYLTDMGSTSPRGAATWQQASLFVPKQTLRIARIKHAGNSNPEPLAFDRLALMLAHQQQIKLEVSAPLDPTELSADDWPVAHITGTKAFELSDAQIVALKNYLADGGTLISDAAGSSGAFAAAFLNLVGRLVSTGKLRDVPAGAPMYRDGPYDVSDVRYRRGTFTAPGGDPPTRPRLQAVYIDDEPRIIYSLVDISGGLVGYPLHGLRGYAPESARQVMANLLIYLHNRRISAAADGQTPLPTHVDLDDDADATVTEGNQ